MAIYVVGSGLRNVMKVRVSDLAQFASCPKRSKLQGLRQTGKVNRTKALRKGTDMHFKYSVPFKSFDRRLLRYKLKWDVEGHVFTRELDDIEIRGIPDDYRVLCHYGKFKQLLEKTVSIIEVKTTSMERLWKNEEDVAVLQLQIYVWLMQPYVEKLGYKLHNRHYVEIYSQKDGHLIKRILVRALPNTEKKIQYIIDAWRGVNPMTYPPSWVCKKCPKSIKENCSRYKYYVESKKYNRFF